MNQRYNSIRKIIFVLLFAINSIYTFAQESKSLGYDLLADAYDQFNARSGYEGLDVKIYKSIIQLKKEDSPMIYYALNLMGTYNLVLGNKDSANFYYSESIRNNPKESINDSLLYAEALMGMFQNDQMNGSLNWARERLTESAEILASIDLESFDSNRLMNAFKIFDVTHLILSGDFYTKIGDYQSAIISQERALALFRLNPSRFPNFLESILLSRLANTYMLISDYDNSLYYYNLSKQSAMYNNDKPNLANSYGSIGTLHAKKGQYDSAIYFIKKSIEINEKIFKTNLNASLNKSFGNLAFIYLQNNDLDSAYSYASMFKMETDPKLYGELNSHIILRQFGLDSALRYYQAYFEKQFADEKIDFLPKEKSVEFDLNVNSLYSFYISDFKNDRRAVIDYLNNLLRTSKNIASLKKTYLLTDANSISHHRYYSLANEFWDVILSNDMIEEYEEELLSISENLKAFKLIAQTATANHFSQKVESLESYKRYEKDIADILNKIDLIKAGLENGNSDSLQLLLLNRKNVLLESGISISKLEGQLNSVDKFQIEEGTIVIEVMALENAYLIIKLFENQQIEITWFDKSIVNSEIERMIIEITDKKPLSEFPTLSKILDTEELSVYRRLLFVPDGKFNFLNLSTFFYLRQPDSDLPSVQYVPSLNFYSLLNSRTKSKCDSIKFIRGNYQRNTDFKVDSIKYEFISELTRSPEFDLLPGIDKEQEGIASIIPINIYNFGTKNGLSLNLSNNRGQLVHFASHAFTNHEYPFLSHLLISNTGKFEENAFNAYEIMNSDLSAELVFLSACNTGIGKYQEGEGIQSLAYSFLYAGAKSVIMTQWKIPDETTPEIVIEFYKNLKKGQRKSEALRNAKLTYLESQEDPLKRHPYYWAGFVLIGDDSPIEFEEEAPWWYWLVGVLLLFIVALVYYRYRSVGSSGFAIRNRRRIPKP